MLANYNDKYKQESPCMPNPTGTAPVPPAAVRSPFPAIPLRENDDA
jgi:hypothetical protein